EGKAVRPLHVADRDRQLFRLGVEPVDAERQLLLHGVAEIVAAAAGAVVAEPDRVVGLDDDVVGAGQPLAFEAVGEQRDRAVILGTGQVLGVVLAGDEPTLPVAGVAVGVVRRLAEHADRTGFFVPAHD